MTDLERFKNIGSLHKVPGDGACFWHAASCGGRPLAEWDENRGGHLKNEVMQWVNTHPELVAELLGGSPSIASSIMRDWEAWDAWADGRAPPLIAHIYDVSVLIVNVKDRCAELFSSQPDVASVTEVWTLHFDSDHYDFLEVHNVALLNDVIAQFNLAPLHSKPLHNVLRGGALVADGSGVNPMTYYCAGERYAGKPFLDRLSSDIAMCHSLNVGGLRTSVESLRGALGDGHHIVCLQETRLTKQGQKSLGKQFENMGWRAVFGSPARLRKNRRGAWRTDCMHPGVGVIATEACELYPAQHRNPATLKWIEQGRFQVVKVCVDPERTVYLMNLYAPSGSQGRKQRQLCIRDVTAEITLWQSEEVLLLGDFQEDLSSSHFYLRAAVHGWCLPPLLCYSGEPVQATYESAGVKSMIDWVLVSPDYRGHTPHVLVTPIEGLQHCLLSTVMPIEVNDRHPRVAYPPKLVRDPSLSTSFESGDYLERLQETAQRIIDQYLHEEWFDIQRAIDGLWDLYQCFFRASLFAKGYRAHRGDRTLSDLVSQGNHKAHWHTAEPAKHKHTSVCLMHRAIGWLTSLARQEGMQRCRAMLNRHSQEIQQSLRLTPQHFQRALDDPSTYIAKWKDALIAFRERERGRATRSWRGKLFVAKARPSKTLFRWLKNLAPSVSLTFTSEQGIHCGPHAFFQQNRSAWSKIMCEQQRGPSNAYILAQDLLDKSEALTYDCELLVRVARAMRRDTAPGLDCWSASGLETFDRAEAIGLFAVFRAVESTGYFPTPWLQVRTHLVPKTEDAFPAVTDFRPLSIMTIWYRLWGAYRLQALHPGIQEQFDPSLRGGIKGRGIEDLVLHPALWLEAAINTPVDKQHETAFHMVSLDASKCFDRITWDSAALALLDLGVPKRLAAVLLRFWAGLNRHFSVAGYLDPQPLLPCNGIPQGCCVSALACNALARLWARRVAAASCLPSAFLDDRYIMASNHDDLQRGVTESMEWERENHWVTNTKKSAWVTYPSDKDVALEGPMEIPRARHVTSLGVDLVIDHNLPMQRQKQRLQVAMTTAQRISTLSLPTHTAQCLIDAVVLPQFCYHAQMRPVPLHDLERMKSAIGKATHVYRRAHSRELIAVFLTKAHRQDPASCAFFTHMMAVADGLRCNRQARQWWDYMLNLSNPRCVAPRGPYATSLIYMERHSLRMIQSGLALSHPACGDCRWLDCPREELAHFLRTVTRNTLLTRAQEKRQVLRGIVGCDIPSTTKMWRQQEQPFQQGLAAILTDGLWTMRRKSKVDGGDGVCRACGASIEDVRHVWLDCPAWHTQRQLPESIIASWSCLPGVCSDMCSLPEQCQPPS